MNCKGCGVELTKKNIQKNGYYTRKKCKTCLRKDVAKYRNKQKKAIKKAGKWF